MPFYGPHGTFLTTAHQVFRLSFDAKELKGREEIEKVIDYIHHNPVSGKWDLVDDFTEYPYSSAGFYEFDKRGEIPLTHYLKSTCSIDPP